MKTVMMMMMMMMMMKILGLDDMDGGQEGK